jgi:hypothetical protein
VVAQVGLLADLKPYGSGKKNFSFPKPTESLIDMKKSEVGAFDWTLTVCFEPSGRCQTCSQVPVIRNGRKNRTF